MPMPTTKGRQWADITKETALAEIRRYQDMYPNSAPEIRAMGLMRQVDSWEEHSAIIAALDAFLAEQS